MESREGSSNKGMEKHDKVMEDNVEQIEIIKIMTTWDTLMLLKIWNIKIVMEC